MRECAWHLYRGRSDHEDIRWRRATFHNFAQSLLLVSHQDLWSYYSERRTTYRFGGRRRDWIEFLSRKYALRRSGICTEDCCRHLSKTCSSRRVRKQLG